jgi:hypothetical protein
MTSVYNDNDLYDLYKQKQKILGVFWAVTALYAVICIVCLCIYISLPYKDPMQMPIQLIVYLVTPPYIVFLFPYMGIKYSRLHRYYKMLVQISLNRKNLETQYFYKFNKNRTNIGLDVHHCVFGVWNAKQQEWREREVYADVAKPLPDFQEGDEIRYVTQSNYLLQYEVLERGVVAFEEVEDEEEF